jgi:phosphoglycerol transferase MdoB-like AlkP superfamily enzyme
MSRGLWEGIFWAAFWGGLALLHRRASGQALLGRPALSDFFPLAVGLPVFLALAALTGRPFLAGGLFAAPVLLLHFFNRVKAAVLHEPLVFADVAMGRQLFFFPRFYWPYIPLKPLLAGAAALAAALALLGRVEAPLAGGARLGCGLAASALALAWAWAVRGKGAAGLWRRFSRPGALAFDPVADGRRYGLAGTAIISGVWQSRFGLAETGPRVKPSPDGLAQGCVWPAALRRPPAPVQPHVVLVQAESFFHLRRLIPDPGPGWTDNFDRLAAEGVSGLMAAQAYGAYTVRTEFAVLTGLAAESLGSFKFNPYSLAARTPVGSLPRWLAGLGYEAVCLHPGRPTFFRRNEVMPNLGFHRFLSADAFRESPRYGPYTADAAVLERAAEELKGASAPKFLFAVTIEAHGPWPAGRLAGRPAPPELKDWPESLLKDGPDGGPAAYARHLRHADALLGGLAGLKLDRPLVLGWYGDHVGSLPSGLALAGEHPTATDFLVWRSPAGIGPSPGSAAGPGLADPVPPEHLGALLLGALARGGG